MRDKNTNNKKSRDIWWDTLEFKTHREKDILKELKNETYMRDDRYDMWLCCKEFMKNDRAWLGLIMGQLL